MTVVTDVSIPVEQFALGRTAEQVPDAEIRLDSLAAHAEDGFSPYVRVACADHSAFETALGEDPSVADVQPLETAPTERLYRIRWGRTPGADRLLEALERTDGAIEDGTCADGEWSLRLLFVDRESLSTFYEAYAGTVPCAVERVFDRGRSERDREEEFGLTAQQHDALVTAFERGYYEVPKPTTIEDVADDLGISAQAVSQRLRRGTANLLENALSAGRSAEPDEAAETNESRDSRDSRGPSTATKTV